MALFGLFGNSETLYFPGCFSSAFFPGKIENYRRIFKKLGISFSLHKHKDREFMCCGGFLDEAGYDRELRKLARENKDYLAGKKFKKIITSCPLCFYILKSKYKDILPDWNIEVEHASAALLDKIKGNQEIAKHFSSEPIVYYDSCYLARYSKLIEEPRELLKLLGYNLAELPKNREESLCCGSCGNFPLCSKELSEKIAVEFVKTLKRKKIKKIVTADIKAYSHLREVLKKLNINEGDIQVLELSDAVCDSLGIKRD